MIRLALTLSVVLLAGSVGTASAAAPAQVGGKITNLPAKKPGGRAVQVIAIHMPDGVIADADRADNGRYSVEVPKGINALMTRVIPFGGPKATSVLSAAIRVKAGENRKLKLRAKKKRKRKPGHGGGGGGGGHHNRSVGAQSARNVAPDGRSYPGEAVSLKYFTGATGEYAAMNKGLSDMLDLPVAAHQGAPEGCEYTSVESKRIDAVVDEINLGKAGLVDPNTKVEPGHIIPPEVFVEGTLSNEFDPPAPLRYEIRIVGAKSGAVRTTIKGILQVDTFFEDIEAMGPRVVRAICGQGDPATPPGVGAPVYSGPVSGDYVTQGVGADLTIAWNGNITYGLTGEGPAPFDAPPPGPYAFYELSSGTVHVTLDYPNPDCSYSGEGDVALPAGFQGGSMQAQEGVAQPAYRLVAQPAGDATLTFTKSGPEAGCSGTGQWPLGGITLASTNGAFQTASAARLVGSLTYETGSGPNSSSWDLSPSG